jgi:hypothetical protein
MHLADIGSSSSPEIQLLADCFQLVFVLELTPIAENLVQRGLLRSFWCTRQHGKGTCFVLTATDSGRARVEAWLDQHSNGANESAIVPAWVIATGCR